MRYIFGPNRVVCEVLTEMRASLRTLNIFTLYRYKRLQESLIEEAQTMVNRMEAGLSDVSDLKELKEECKRLTKESVERGLEDAAAGKVKTKNKCKECGQYVSEDALIECSEVQGPDGILTEKLEYYCGECKDD